LTSIGKRGHPAGEKKEGAGGFITWKEKKKKGRIEGKKREKEGGREASFNKVVFGEGRKEPFPLGNGTEGKKKIERGGGVFSSDWGKKREEEESYEVFERKGERGNYFAWEGGKREGGHLVRKGGGGGSGRGGSLPIFNR